MSDAPPPPPAYPPELAQQAAANSGGFQPPLPPPNAPGAPAAYQAAAADRSSPPPPPPSDIPVPEDQPPPPPMDNGIPPPPPPAAAEAPIQMQVSPPSPTLAATAEAPPPPPVAAADSSPSATPSIEVSRPSPSSSPAPHTPQAVRSTPTSALNVTPPSTSSSPAPAGSTLSAPFTRTASGSIIGANAPVLTASPSGSFAPVARKPVAIVPKPQSSGTYQSLSFDDAAPGPSSIGLSSGKHPAIARKDIAATGVSGLVSNSPATSSIVPAPRINRSGSIDRLTGRIPLPPATASPLKVGWLKKEGEGVLGGFKKRWCVLNAKTLDFFKEITDEKPQGTIVLPGASIFMEDKTDFHILPVRAAKKISFRCESEFDRNTWYKVLQDLVTVSDSLLERVFDADSYVDWSNSDISNILLPSLTRLLSKVGTMSSIWGVGDQSNVGVLLSGFLTKMGDKVKNFKRRYFVLVGSLLLYFENEESYMLTDTGSASSSSSETEKVQPVLGHGAPSAPSLMRPVSVNPAGIAASKEHHGKAVLASLTRNHLRAQRRSITPVDLQNHHLIRRASHHVALGRAASATLADEEKRKKELQKKVLAGGGRAALGMIPLKDCELNLEPTNSRAYGFSVQTRDRKYFLFADNEDELRAWYYMINLIINSLPIQRYMKTMLEAEDQPLETIDERSVNTSSTSANSAPSTSSSSSSKAVSLLSDAELDLLKKQLQVTLLDPTCVRFFQNYWLERQSFHEPRTYPYLFPLDSPLTMLTERGTKFFEGLLVDEAGDRGENVVQLPIHYLYFWLDIENWANLRVPSKAEGEGEINPFATAQDPSYVENLLPLAPSYRQHRAEEIIDKYLGFGAPYPVYLEHDILDEIIAHSIRGANKPSKQPPPNTLFQRAQELVTEMLAIEVFPRYLKSKSSYWSYLPAMAAKYDETMIVNRAEGLVETLLARAYDPEVYEELSHEEKEEEENDRLKRFQNLVSLSDEEVDAIALDCAEQFGQLPGTDSTKVLYHNYLYALQRLREYHYLFSAAAQQPGSNQPNISLAFRQTQAARNFFHDFLLPGAPFAICVPYKLTRNIRALLLHAHPRRQFLFMDIEHLIITELQFGCSEARNKIRRQVNDQKGPLKKSSVNPATGMAGGNGLRRSVSTRSSVASRASVAVSAMGGVASGLDVVKEGNEATAAPMVVMVDQDVPFNMVFGASSLFSHFRRFSLTCRHMNPQYLWDQVALVARIMDYRQLSDPKVMTAYARQVFCQYISENAPHKINLSKATVDQFKVNVSQQSPGPHVFLNVLKELYKNLEHLYNNTYKILESNQSNYSYLQEDFGLFIRNEICITQGKRDFNFDANISLMSNNKNASTWFDILDTDKQDESLINLSSHLSIWCVYFKQFLMERFCAENASFYVEADDYRRCPGPSYRILKAKRLYEKYISETAQLQVNVPSGVARELTSILQRDGGGAGSINASVRATSLSARPSSALASDRSELNASSPLLYIAAQREIFLLMQNDSLKPFLSSDSYKQYKGISMSKI